MLLRGAEASALPRCCGRSGRFVSDAPAKPTTKADARLLKDALRGAEASALPRGCRRLWRSVSDARLAACWGRPFLRMVEPAAADFATVEERPFKGRANDADGRGL